MCDDLSKHYRDILVGLGENPEREGLLDTPKRAAKAIQYLCNGYEKNLDEIVNNALFESESDEMVIVRDIELYSLCEHHMLPIFQRVKSLVYPKLHALWICMLVAYKSKKTSPAKSLMQCKK